MKANVIFAAIVLSMISAVAFGQEAAVVDDAVGAVSKSVDAGKTAATVGTTATGAAAISGAASSTANVINMNSAVVKSTVNSTETIATSNDAVGAQCTASSALTKLAGADFARVQNAIDHNLLQKTDCLNDTDVAMAEKISLVLGDEANTLQSLGVNTPEQLSTQSQKLSFGQKAIQSLAARFGFDASTAANRSVLLCEHKAKTGVKQICYSTQAACDDVITAAQQYWGVTPATATM